MPSLGKTLKDGGIFILPLLVLTISLIMGFTPTMVGIMGTISILIVSLFSYKTRIGLISLAKALSETCYRIVPVAGACAAVA